MASKHLVVKATLQYPEGLELGTSPDIRRFRLAREAAADVKGDLYCRLVDSLSTAFPDINGVDYSLFWKDGEGDLVQFSTLAELQIAIDAMTDHVLRVYVIVHFDDIEDTTEADTDEQSESTQKQKGKRKRVRFSRAGRKFRRKIRRRRRAALSDPKAISKEYRMGARALIRRLHLKDKDDEKKAPQQANAALAEMAPEVRDFIQQMHEDWHSKLATQRPVVVARRMRMKKRTLPPGMERDHFLWLLRLLGRWHRRHAGLCRAMAGWSSGDTEADESGGEETIMSAVRRQKRKQRRARRSAGAMKEEIVGGEEKEEEEEKEESPGQRKVVREFRQAVRILMKRMHKKGGKPADDQEKATLATLKPEVQSFIQKVADDWHALLAEKKPGKVAKRMKKKNKKTLPADLPRDHYLWLCRYFKRWHSRHAALCDVMSGWSSGEEEKEDPFSEVEEEEEQGKGKKGKSSSSSSSESDSEGKKKKKKAVPKEFVKAARVLVNRLHNRKPKKEEKANEEETILAALSPEDRAFVQSFVEEWDRKLANGKSPLLVAKRMQRKNRPLPAGLEKNHVQFLCRFLARWHCKHAAFCAPMGSWSSGETGGESETSGDERQSLRRRARLTAALEVSTASEQEDTDCVETACKPVSKEFRAGVRQWLNQHHKKPAADSSGKKQGKQQAKPQDDKEKITLSPEVQEFLQRFWEEWHAKLTSGRRPRAASREMKTQASAVSLPSRMEREQYLWLCCFMARWHRKHDAKCTVLAQGEVAVQA